MLVTSAALDALRVQFRLDFNSGWNLYPPQWDRIATLVPSSTRENRYGWIRDFPRMREWVGDRVIKSISEGDYTIVNRDWEDSVGLKRKDIEDDILGIYKPMMEGLGSSAREFMDELVFGLLTAGFTTPCWDGQYFFDEEHPLGGTGEVYSNLQGPSGNDAAGAPWFLMATKRPLKPLILQERKKPEFVAMVAPTDEVVFSRAEYRYGVDARYNAGFGFPQMCFASTAPLTAPYYAALRQAMTSQSSDEGHKLNIVPDLVVVGPSNRAAAKQLFQAERIASGADNIYFKDVDILESAWLQ